ncbi:MAG: exo-alpha-sialidase [Gemmatimonadetes bacterium]|nr:exo-alpha-sialidase [Gemmatimonadota bacterium]MBT6146374.1 exo-alpha-sialidase [Gemmatimonadota bacterium]MBT7861835.1 exo-alpha-sialidase [Gemmatimonadota bacterium]
MPPRRGVALARSAMSVSDPHTVPTDPGVEWVKDEASVVEPPPDGEVDPVAQNVWPASARRTGVYGVVTPNVIRLHDGNWRLYYTQILPRPGHPAGANDYDNSTSRILSSTSADGVTWSPEPGVRLSPQAAGGGEFRVVSPEVVPLGDGSGELRMYYECCPGPQSTASTIRSARSSDGGVNWALEEGQRLAGGGSYNSPRVVVLDDGRWRLYCSDRGVGIISSISADGGRTFQREEGIRIAPSTPFEAVTAFAPEVLRIAGAGYRMYYAGYSALNRAYILSAVSEDGLTWHKQQQPVISPGGRWDAAKCSEMCVTYVGDSGTRPSYRLFYEACDGTAPDQRGVWRIASATASHTG